MRVSGVVFVGGREGAVERQCDVVAEMGHILKRSSIHRMTSVCTYIRIQNDAVLHLKKNNTREQNTIHSE